MSVRLTPDQIRTALLAMGIRPSSEPVAALAKKKPPKPFPILLPMATEHGSGRWEIELPGWRPTSLSKLMHVHWRVAAKWKKKDALHVASALQAAGVTGALGKRRLVMTIVLGPRQRPLDSDNVWKGLKDGCKRCRAFKDDSPKWCEHPDPLYERGKEQATRLLLEDV